MMGERVAVLVIGMVVAIAVAATRVEGNKVTYDGRSLIINGTRRMLFSGSIHYPRSTPEMWPSLIAKAKEGGLDVIDTYVFWNVHEPTQGLFNFEGNYDIVKFIKEIRDQGLYVCLRIGPFIQGEWKYGGLPYWLRDIPGIVFRTNNAQFKFYMQKFVSMIVNMMKSEGLYASQGGPIIISQIENEYGMVEPAYHKDGPPYVRWAASMAVGLQTGVPWVMCKQDDAPDPVINSCNGLRCGETFAGPNSATKPSLWTENWTTIFTKFGEEPEVWSAERIAFQVALFIAKRNGSYVNYYMYHGGTNFGRWASAYKTTNYYDLAPVDEYGSISQPKWGHLKELHAAIKQSAEALLSGTYTNFSLGRLQEAHVFQAKSGMCAAFLINYDGRHGAAVQFKNTKFELPRTSISILPDCKTAVYNTGMITSGYNERSTSTAQHFDQVERWEAFWDGIYNFGHSSFTANDLLEHLATTKDSTDYVWFSVSYNHNSGDDQKLLFARTRGHAVHAFVNNVHVGSAHGEFNKPGALIEKPISLRTGQNNITLLSVMVGLPDNNAFMENKKYGLNRVRLNGKNNADFDVDLSKSLWGYKVGLQGEKLKIYSQEGSSKLKWKTIGKDSNVPLMWYKTTFDAPSGDEPLALNLLSMGKGEAWINGESIGRYWVSFKTLKGQPAQSLYHIPRSFLKPSGNLLVLFEEEGGNPLQITLEKIFYDTVKTLPIDRECGFISESYPSQFSQEQQHSIQLQCFGGKSISSIEFASYGNSTGDCQNYVMGSCHAASSKSVIEKFCLGRADCSIPTSATEFGGDPCPGTPKSLLVEAICG